MRSVSESLATFASELEFSAIPPEVIAKAKLHLLDLVGVALASASMDFGRAACAAAREMGGERQSSLIGFDVRVPAVWAAMANGTLAHGLDYDDTHLESVVHVSAGVVPAALAAVEAARGSGPTLLTALVLGLETSIRIGLGARGCFHDHGFHPTGVCNAFAAALLAGRVMGLSPRELANALGIAGSQASGLMEFLTDGSDVKRIHPGWAAHAGLVAARLARHGFTGPQQVFEGRFGLYRSHLGEQGWDAAAVTADLGTRWHCLDIALKPYPSCHYNHAFIDAAAALKQAHQIRPEEIEAIECLIAEREVPVVCEPLATKRTPQTDYDAKFSLPYAVASMLVRDHVDVEDFTDDAIRDTAVLAMARRVSYRPDPDADYPRRFGGTLHVRLKDGRRLAHAEPVNRGSAERPLTADEVEEKFERNAARVLIPQGAVAIVEAIELLEESPNIRPLAAALRGSDSATTRAAAS